MKFRVLGGEHEHYDGKIYKKGDILECDMDIRLTFANKFEKVEKETPITSAPVSESPMKKKSIIPLVNKNPIKEKPIRIEKEVYTTQVKDESNKQDVTSLFKIAEQENLKVYKDEKGYYVYEEDNLQNALNKDPFTKPKIKKFIEQFINS